MTGDRLGEVAHTRALKARRREVETPFMNSHRFATMAAAVTTSLVAATILPVLPASAQAPSQPTMLSGTQINVVEGSEVEVSVNWTAPVEMQNFRVTVTPSGKGVSVAYAPGHTSAGLVNDAVLSAGEIDSTTFLLKTSVDSSDKFSLQLVAEWEVDGQTFRSSPTTMDVRSEKYKGDRFAVLTESATVSSTGDGTGNWVELDFLGLSPLTEGIRVELDTKDVLPYYPQGTFTSLHHDDRLHGDETDVARVWFDPDAVEPGTYKMKIEVTFLEGKAGSTKTKTEDFSFTLTVR